MVMDRIERPENMCPVCGFGMEEAPANYNICPCCGTEFGLNDVNTSIINLRENWVRSGMKWWSKTDPQPQNWNPFSQLAMVFVETTSAPIWEPIPPAWVRGVFASDWFANTKPSLV